ncbi:hypothetical protein GCM10009116_11230 [Brevundimonas basaltis]|uniref:Uncharacterized protein n=1 Tax=Brevundimonas basaltis TaxID=472166 RepID=A0A7W8HV81_9CAUL|nr:hypothetical protein [Brevundimonas basaltis]MBB5290561.1 hypothetical protein [Brevundimonas basaltis]
MAHVDPNIVEGIQRSTGLTHETVARKVPYYYCNEAELEALKGVGLIFNACFAFGVGGLFFGLPLILGGAVLSVGGELQPEASRVIGWVAFVFSVVLFLIAFVSHRSGSRLMKQLKGAKA